MAEVWVRARTVGKDIVLYTKRWWLPKWFPGSAKLHGNLSSVSNRTKVKLNQKCKEIENLLYELQQLERDHTSEMDYVKGKKYDRAGETKWYREDVKFLKTFQVYVDDPGDHFKKVLNPGVLKKYNFSNTNTEGKKSSHDDIPDNLAGSGDRSIYVLNGVPQAAKNQLEADLGGDHMMGFQKPSGKEKSKKSGKGKNNGHWKNRRSGETQEEYDDRMAEGDPDN